MDHHLSIPLQLAIIVPAVFLFVGGIITLVAIRAMDRRAAEETRRELRERGTHGGLWPVDSNGFPVRRRTDDLVFRARSDDRGLIQSAAPTRRACPTCSADLEFFYARFAAQPAWHCLTPGCPEQSLFDRWPGQRSIGGAT